MSRLRLLVIAVILASTVAFVIGAAVERAETGSAEQNTVHREAPGGERGHEGRTESEAQRHAEAPREPSHPESGEELLGINPESTGLTVAAVLTSLALAVGMALLRRSVLVLVAVLVVMLAFAALDVRELLHQLDESRGGLAALAAVVAALHLGAAGGAVALMRRTPPTSQVS
jgi:hypothetical protein